jgi:toxin ParE1/3/4
VDSFRFTRLAETDLTNIGMYSLGKWGEAQTIKYLDELESACRRLARAPASGRACDHIRPGLYRCEVGKHVIFYRCAAGDIVISRILHQRMLPERHFFAEWDDD